jgi:hypothetical protein
MANACFASKDCWIAWFRDCDLAKRQRFEGLSVLRGLIRDSVEGIVWAVPAGGEGAPVERPGARQDNRLFLDGRACVCYCFSELTARPARRFMGPGWRLRFHAKRKGGQALENKQLREISPFAPPMISRTYDQRRETARFARRKESFVFAGSSAPSRPKTQGSEVNGGFGARAADIAQVRLDRTAVASMESERLRFYFPF